MTRQEIQVLIDTKIAGQGTAVDAGSVLPVILSGILDLIEQGGGGTSDAVQYIPQELTEAQQMQARKNQDIYNTMTMVDTDDFNGAINEPYVDPGTGVPYDWFGPYKMGSAYGGFVFADVPLSPGYVVVSENGFKINGKDPIITSGENWEMMVDPDNNNSILVKTTANFVSVRTKFGTISFPYSGLYASGELYIEQQEYEGEIIYYFNAYVSSFSENLTVSLDVVTQVPYKYIPTQSVGSSADDQHFPTAKNVYDYIRNNSNTGAVRYDINQSLSDSNKMRARKNQGLYYSERSSTTTVYPAFVWDGNLATSYGQPVMGDGFSYFLISYGFLFSTVASINISTGVIYTMGTDLERRTVDNYSGSRGWFIVGENTPALVLEIYATEEEPVTYNGLTFTDGGVYFLGNYNAGYFVEALNVTGQQTIQYNIIPVAATEHLVLEFKRTDNQTWTCNHTFREAYRALIKGGAVLASVTFPDYGTLYSTHVYYTPEDNSIAVEFLENRTSSRLGFLVFSFSEEDGITFDIYEMQGGGE